MENKYKDLVIDIRDYLRNLAEDKDMPISKKVYDALWAEIQSIDHDLKELDKKNDN